MASNTMPVGRPARRPPVRPTPTHKSAKSVEAQSAKAMVVQGSLIGAAVVVALVVIYAFGSAGLSTVGGAARGTAEAPAAISGNTTIYRDMRDGRVMVLEVDEGGGTRVVGTIAKEEVPMAGNMYRDSRAHGLDSTTRLNAFSKTFK